MSPAPRPGDGLDALFRPNAIAVVGASQDATKIGGRPVRFLRDYAFPGVVYPVNPRASQIQGLRAYLAVRPAPVTEAEAAEMLRSLKAFPVLDGARGRKRADLPAASAAIAAVSRFAAQHADAVLAIAVNPLLVRPEGEGEVALDALIVPATDGDLPHGR